MEDYFGYEILYQINITDIDDKIILRARQNKLIAVSGERLFLVVSSKSRRVPLVVYLAARNLQQELFPTLALTNSHLPSR